MVGNNRQWLHLSGFSSISLYSVSNTFFRSFFHFNLQSITKNCPIYAINISLQQTLHNVWHKPKIRQFKICIKFNFLAKNPILCLCVSSNVYIFIYIANNNYFDRERALFVLLKSETYRYVYAAALGCRPKNNSIRCARVD